MNTKMTKSPKRILRSIVFACLVLALVLNSIHFDHPGYAAIENQAQDSITAESDDNIFGAEMVQITDYYGLNRMIDTDPDPAKNNTTPWIRVNGVLWSNIEPNPGEYHWELLTDLDSQINTALANGMEVMLVVRSTPSWAQKYPGYPCGPIAENNLKDFANFMSLLVTHYIGKVRYWEIWNEPDAALGVAPANDYYGCWGITSDPYYGGEYYSEMLKLVYPEIKAADPNSFVIVGGLMMDCGPGGNCPNTNILKFFEGILRNGSGSNFDGVAFHAFDYYTGGLGNYGNAAWNTSRATFGPVGNAKADYLLNLLGQYGVMGKFLMNTEVALVCDTGCTDPQNIFENTKAYYVAQAYATALSRNLKANIWYGARMGWRNTDLLYLDTNLTPRPAYYAFKFGRMELDGAKYQRELTQFAGVMGYQFDREDKRIWVLWSKDGVNHQVPLPAIPYAIYDVDGTPQTITTLVTIKLEPFYIELPRQFFMYMPVAQNNYQAILNGNFERVTGGIPNFWTFDNGGFSTSLVTSNPTNPQLDTSIPMGSYSVLLGQVLSSGCPLGNLPIGYAGINQTFTVPYTPASVPVRVTFKYIIYTQDIAPTVNYDAFEVRINNQVLFSDMNKDINPANCAWYRIPASSGWKSGSIDITAYRGQTVTISFQNWNRIDGYYDTVTYLDQVYLELGNPIP